MITFEQVKQAVWNKYKEYLDPYNDFPGYLPGGMVEKSNEILDTVNLEELTCVLDQLGFNKDEAYYFILESIIK
jgi:hypothetical protein